MEEFFRNPPLYLDTIKTHIYYLALNFSLPVSIENWCVIILYSLLIEILQKQI